MGGGGGGRGGAFLYLVWTSGRNRVLSRINRAKSPRYLITLVIGGAYLWAFLLRPTGRAGAATFLLGQRTEMVATVFALFAVVGTWAFGGDRTALAYTQAEVSLLFSAPLSRRALVFYKLYRAQIPVLINTLIWVFIFRRGGTLLPSWLRAGSLWVMFSTLNLHRLGAALVRASWSEHRGAGVRRQWVSTAVFAVLLAIVAMALITARARLAGAGSPGAFLSALAAILAAPPASVALLPFHLIVAPTFATSSAAWARAMVPALLVLAAHLVWVLRTDAAFEEAAIEASVERARRIAARRSRQFLSASAPTRAPARTLPLSASGHPAVGIIWKNTLCLARTSQLRLFFAPTIMALAVGFALGGGDDDVGKLVASCAVSLAAMLLLFAGRMVRNDLRHDMLHLPMLKSLPLSGRDIVLAEVASSAMPMAAVQFVLLVAAFIAVLTSTTFTLPRSLQSGIMFGAPFSVIALNGALFTIENGRAVLLPGWTQLGALAGGGVEALGQNLMGLMAGLILLALGLVIPVGVGALIFVALGRSPAVGTAAGLVAAAGILLAETYAVMTRLGVVLEKTEPAETL